MAANAAAANVPAGNAPAGPGAALARPVVAFALMPAQAFAHGLVDYDSREGIALYRSNTRSLYTDTTQLFNAKSDMFLGFLNHVNQRIREANWEHIFDVPDVLNAPVPILRSFTTNHGTFTLEHLTNFATVYMAAQGRQAQDNFMAATAVMSSLSEDALAKISPWREQYTIAGEISALCLLKVTIRESHLDSNATTRFARENLSSLDHHIKTQGYDIVKLNTFVQVQLDTLRSRGEQTLDLLNNLFKGYKAARDDAFVRYIEDKQSLHDDETINLNPEMLMILASNKYKVLVEGGLWEAPTKDKAKILALETQITQLTSSVKGKTGKSTAGVEGTPKANTTDQRVKFQPEPWMSVKPSDEHVANNVSKVDKGREYWWCIHHTRYCQHKSSECKLAAKSSATQPAVAQGNNAVSTEQARALSLTQALAAIVGHEDEQE